MIDFEMAQAVYRAVVAPLAAEKVPLLQARGRLLRADAQAVCDLPPFDQSAMDGYALRAAEAVDGLAVAGRVEAGSAAGGLPQAAAMRILTGAPVPAGADAVIPQEAVDLQGAALHFRSLPAQGANIRRRGEELRRGATLLCAGHRLQPASIAALAAAGVGDVWASRRPKVALLITGDELCAPGSARAEAAIYDANGPFLQSFLAGWDVDLVDVMSVPDRREAVDAALQRALSRAELVLSTGGASVGDRDFLPQAVRDAGLQLHFWKVAQKPGKPLLFASGAGRYVLAMPGNPAAVFVGAHLHLRPILERLSGASGELPWLQGQWVDPPPVHGQRLQFLRVLEAQPGRLSRLPHQASHMLSNLAQANAIAMHQPGPVRRQVAFLRL